MIAPFKITWENSSSLEFDLWTEIAFDDDSRETSSFLNRDSVVTERFDGSNKRIHGYKWYESFVPTITFVKQNYKDFDYEENRRILSWLTSNDKPGWLNIYHDDSEVVSYRLYGNWTEIEQYKLTNGRVIGYVCSFESSSPYVFSQKFDTTKQILGLTSFDIFCTSDEYNKLLYPKMTITFNDNMYFPVDENPMPDTYTMIPNVLYLYEDNSYVYINQGDKEDQGKYSISGTFNSIENQEIDSSMIGHYYYSLEDNGIYKGVLVEVENGEEIINNYGFKYITKVGIAVQIKNSYILNGEEKETTTTFAGNIKGEAIVLDGANKVVASTITPTRIIGNDFNWVWTPLAVGENKFKVIGDCTIKFEWVEPRKVGSL